MEKVPGESAYQVFVAQDGDKNYVEPETGKYKMTFSASYTDEYERTFTDEDNASFEVQVYDKFWRWLFWLLLVILIIIIITAIRNHAVLPAAIYLSAKRSCHSIKISGNSVLLSTDLYPGEIRCEAKACTPLKNRTKTIAAFEVKSIKAAGSVNWFEIDGTRFKKAKNGKYINSDGETAEQMKPLIRVSDDTELKWNTNRHTVSGRIYINHND
jgi:hypothetical protein